MEENSSAARLTYMISLSELWITDLLVEGEGGMGIKAGKHGQHHDRAVADPVMDTLYGNS